MTTRQLLIGGEWVDGADGGYDVVNPATEEVVDEAPEASVAQAARRRPRRARRVRLVVADEARVPGRAAAEGRRRDQGALRGLLPLVIAETGCTATVGKQMQVPTAWTRFETYAAATRWNRTT